jgi:hypothetical protein
MTARNRPDIVSGLLFTIFGAATFLLSRRYDMGTLSDMGPGYFPAMGGVGLLIVGLVVTVRGFFATEAVEIERLSLKHVVLVLGPVLAFGILLQPVGMVISSLILVIGSAYASQEFHWRYAVFTAIVLTAGCYAIFVYGLGLPMPTWPKGL